MSTLPAPEEPFAEGVSHDTIEGDFLEVADAAYHQGRWQELDGPGGLPVGDPVIFDIDKPAAPEPGEALGLFHTTAELQRWQDRADGNDADSLHYIATGDVSTNSPGDWNRIVANRNTFVGSPLADLWSGPTDLDASGCVVRSSSTSNDPSGSERRAVQRMTDAAFHYLVTGNTSSRDAVIARLDAQLDWSEFPRLDFSDRSLWCVENNDLNPIFIVAHWLGGHLLALDWVGREHFSSSQLARFDGFFYWFAELVEKDVHGSFTGLWPNRHDEDWPDTANNFAGNPPYLGGDLYSVQTRRTANRYAGMARYFAMAAWYLDSHGYSAASTSLSVLKHRAGLFVKEFLRFGLYPPSADPAGTGAAYTADFPRSTSGDPDKGLAYGSNLLAHLITIADVAARHGDTSLYDHSTTFGTADASGHHGSKNEAGDPAKTMLQAALTICRYYNRTYDKRDRTDTARLDGRNAPLILDTHLARLWLYYQARDGNTADVNEVRDTIRRTHAGAAAYPSSPQSNGPSDPNRADTGMFPAALFMSDLPGVDPFGVS